MIQREAATRRYLASRFAWLAARLYPTAGVDELELLNSWMVWLFMFDDQFDDDPTTFTADHVESILDTYRLILFEPAARHAHEPAAEALRDLCRRTYARMPAWWRRRYTRHVLQFLDTYVWAVRNHLTGAVPTLDVYVEKRRHNGAMHIAIDLIDVAQPNRIPESVRDGTPIETLANITNDVVCWTNDLFSLRKELARADVNNLVVVLQHAHSWTLQRAIDEVDRMITAHTRAFLATADGFHELQPAPPGDVRAYVDALRACMRGNLDWSSETYRYAHVDRPDDEGASEYLEDLLSPPAPRTLD